MKKKILIKCTSSCGTAMVRNAEAHTLISFANALRCDYKVIISGIESNSFLLKKLDRKDISIIQPFIRYLNLKFIKNFIHIPVSIINLYFDIKKEKPDLLMCLGGVFYNGLSILIMGKLFKIKFLIRSAEDYYNVFKMENRSFNQKLYAFVRYLISKFVICNSDHFLTVGEYSLNMFRSKYKVLAEKSYNICGPIDEQIINYKEFNFSKEDCKSNIVQKFSLLAKKLILFVSYGGDDKGTNHMIKLAEEIHKKNLDINILWITLKGKIPTRYNHLKNIIKLIKPLQKNKLVEVIKGVDFLFFATNSRVGYGQILLETLICETEVICFRPKGDILNFVDKSYYINFEDVIERLNNNVPSKEIIIPPFMNKNEISSKLKILMRKLLNE